MLAILQQFEQALQRHGEALRNHAQAIKGHEAALDLHEREIGAHETGHERPGIEGKGSDNHQQQAIAHLEQRQLHE